MVFGQSGAIRPRPSGDLMGIVVQERVDRLSDVLEGRRQQVVFRLGIAVVIIVFYQGLLGLGPTLGWAAIYAALQLVEGQVFSRTNTARRVRHAGAYNLALGLIAANTAVFGCMAVLWPLSSGPWGVSNGAFLIAGAMLNTVMTTQQSRASFIASVAPLVVYAAIVPVEALVLGCGWNYGLGMVVGAVMLVFCAVKLWIGGHGAFKAERAARADAERRRAEAESAVAAKSAFVAMVSHELRTPISAILAGATELERISGGVGRSHARLISDAGSMMRTLLNDLLDLAKLDAGRMTVENLAYDFRALMADQMRFWRAESLKKGVPLRLTGARAAPGWVQGDPMRLRQILNNLMSNALKFTEAGSVTVSIAAAPLAEDRTRLDISVTDTGSGMTEAQVARLFQPFAQADASVARTHGGTGLGLVISRQLARKMDGDIAVETRHGQGSCFTVSLVVGAAQAVVADEDEAQGPQAPSAMSVLVVDDHDINRRAISLMLEPLSAEVTVVASGREALAALALRPFDVVLMDVQMPDMDGREAVRRLRVGGGPNQATPVIAVTGATEASDVQACLAAGMTDWVAKPIDAGQLYNALARQLGESEDEVESAAA